jgi:hypothetical protein
MAPTTDTTPVLLSSLSVYCPTLIYPAQNTGFSLAGNNWPTANLAILIPLALPFAYTVRRAFWVNAGAVAGNVDCGIYDANFSRVASTGAVAQAGLNTVQYGTLVTTLQPGSYYLALTLSANTGGFFGSTSMGPVGMGAAGCVQMAAANPLPATITPVIIANNLWSYFGITRTSSGF